MIDEYSLRAGAQRAMKKGQVSTPQAGRKLGRERKRPQTNRSGSLRSVLASFLGRLHFPAQNRHLRQSNTISLLSSWYGFATCLRWQGCQTTQMDVWSGFSRKS